MIGIQRRINYSLCILDELLEYNVLAAVIVSVEFKPKVLGGK